MRRARWPVIVGVLALAFGAALYVMVVRGYYQGIAPAPGADIQALAQHGGFRKIRQVEKAGSVFYLAEGKLPPSCVLASGPPIYVSDARGLLVEWIEDSGDQRARMSKWETSPSEELSLEQVLQSLKR